MAGSNAYAGPQMAYTTPPAIGSNPVVYPPQPSTYPYYPNSFDGNAQSFYPYYGVYTQPSPFGTTPQLASAYQQQQLQEQQKQQQWEKQYREWSSLYESKKRQKEPTAEKTGEKIIGPTVPGANKPYLIMKNMGFVKGKGLGKELQGSLEAPVIKVQNSKSGLGFEKPEKIGLVKCVLCEKVFNNAEQLVLHAASKRHRTAARKRNQTPKPGYEMLHLFRESTVDQHKADATNSGIFLCMPCEVSFKDVESTKHHITSVEHEPLKLAAPYSCEICGLALNSEFQWNEHLSSTKHTKKAEKLGGSNRPDNIASPTQTTLSASVVSKPETKESYSCEVCGVSFNSVQQKEQHLIGKKHIKAVNRQQFTNLNDSGQHQQHPAPQDGSMKRKRPVLRRNGDSLKRGRYGEHEEDKEDDAIDEGILIDRIDEWGRPIFADPIAFLNNINSSLYVNVLVEPELPQQQLSPPPKPPVQQVHPTQPPPQPLSVQKLQLPPQQPQQPQQPQLVQESQTHDLLPLPIPLQSQPLQYVHSQHILPQPQPPPMWLYSPEAFMMYTQEQQDDYGYFPFYQDTLPQKPPSPQHHYSEAPHEESVPSYCVLCDKEFNSEFQSRQHFAGKGHKRKQVAALKGNVPPVSALQKPVAFTKAQ